MKKIFSLILIFGILIFTFTGCSSQEQNTNVESAITFTDALDREVTVTASDRVGVASGSFADCWLLAGGTLTATTQDAIDDWNLELSEAIISLGSVMDPSAETILEADLDLLILSANMKNHLNMAETLDKAHITYAYLDVETFEDYLNMLKIFTDITGRSDLYEKNGTAIAQQIDTIIEENALETSPKVLILRTSSSKITARDSETMVGQMLKNLGCENIADSENSLLEELSLEIIAQENPEYIFVICHGEAEEAKANLETMLASNPIWSTLDAVKNNRLYYLEKELFHYKPNARWAESYQVLADIFSN